MPKWPKVWYPVPNLPPRLHENEHSRTPGILLKLEGGANFNKPGMKVVCIYCRLAWLDHLHQLVLEPGSSSLDDLFFASVWGWKSQVSIVSEFAFVEGAGVAGGLTRHARRGVPFVGHKGSPTDEELEAWDNPRNVMKWFAWFRPLGLLFLFSTCTTNLACCRGHGSAGSARTQVPREWEALGMCCTRCMTVSKGMPDVDSQRNISPGWHSKTWTLQCLCLHPWSTSKQSPVPCCPSAGVREETLTLIETIRLPRVWQLGSINSPWGSREFGHDWTVQPPATPPQNTHL